MIKFKKNDNKITIEGSFDLGYLGIYNNLELDDELHKIDISRLDEYFNNFQKKISDNILIINNNLLFNIMNDLDQSLLPYWEIEGLVDNVITDGNLEEYYYNNRVSIDKVYDLFENNEDLTVVFKNSYPHFNLDKFIKSIIPTSLYLSDCNISFQCDDGLGAKILCCAYDEITEDLEFIDWHNH
ncbi:MAG: hypothetical protein R3Y05_05040 [bacterium]